MYNVTEANLFCYLWKKNIRFFWSVIKYKNLNYLKWSINWCPSAVVCMEYVMYSIYNVQYINWCPSVVVCMEYVMYTIIDRWIFVMLVSLTVRAFLCLSNSMTAILLQKKWRNYQNLTLSHYLSGTGCTDTVVNRVCSSL